MEVLILPDSLYLIGTVAEVRAKLREYLSQYESVRELIKSSRH